MARVAFLPMRLPTLVRPSLRIEATNVQNGRVTNDCAPKEEKPPQASQRGTLVKKGTAELFVSIWACEARLEG